MKVILLLLLILPQDKLPDAVKRAQTKLEASPEDAEANQTVGKFLLDKSDFEKGLPFLSKGTDTILKPVAEKDIAGTKEPVEMVKIGDLWIEAGEKRAALKARCQERALFWFQKAWPFLEGKEKDGLRRIFSKISVPPVGYAKPGKKQDSADGWEAFNDLVKSFLDDTFAHSGKRSIKILPGGTDNGGSSAQTIGVPAQAGKKYKASAWIFTEQTDVDGAFSLRFMDSTGKGISGVNTLMLMDCPFWQKIEVEGEAPSGTLRVLINMHTKIKTGAMWVDDVRITLDGKDCAKNGGVEGK